MHRPVTIGAFGNTYWASRLRESLQNSDVDVRCLYADQETILKDWSVSQWLSQRALRSVDVLHVLGWPMLWNLWLATRILDVPTVCHWVGTDVSSFLRSPRWSRVAGRALNLLVRVHLADSPELVDELRSVGVYARHESVGLRPFDHVSITPLPQAPCALAMLRPDKFELYGGHEVMHLAAEFPQLRWLIVANDGTGCAAPANVTFLGSIDDRRMEEVYAKTTMLVRLTHHDGMSQMVLEAMARGKHVVWSRGMPFCHHATNVDEAKAAVRAILAANRVNADGAAYVRKTYDAGAQVERLSQLYRCLVGR